MSGVQRAGLANWAPGHTRIGILAGPPVGPPRRVAWLVKGGGDLSIGVARATGWGTQYAYRQDGSFVRFNSPAPGTAARTTELVARHPPISEIKGLLHLLSVDVGQGDRLPSFPFRKRFEPVHVKPLNGRVTFRIGLLEPGVPEALDTIKRKEERHFRLFTRSQPWILLWNSAGFDSVGTGRGPTPGRLEKL